MTALFIHEPIALLHLVLPSSQMEPLLPEAYQTRIDEELSEIVRAAESFSNRVGNDSEIGQKISGIMKLVDDATERQRDDVYAVSFDEVIAMKRTLVRLGVGALEMERGKEVIGCVE